MNKIAADTAFIIRIVPEYFKRVTIKPVESIFGAKPQKALFILDTAYSRIIRKTVFHLEMTEIVRLTQATGSYKKQES